MPKAAKSHITTSAPATEAITGDPALVVAYQINRLWDAYHGADCEAIELKHKGETTNASIVRDHANQIGQWRDALETVLSFTRATTLAGALFQMVIAAEDLDTLLSNLECRLSQADSEDKVDLSDLGIEESGRLIQRLYRSATNAIRANLNEHDWDSGIALYGDPSDNWLRRIDEW